MLLLFVQSDTVAFVVTRMFHPVYSHILLWATFCTALVPVPLFLLLSVSGGQVSALEITLQKLFSVDFFSVFYLNLPILNSLVLIIAGGLEQFMHLGPSVVSLLCVVFSTEYLHRRQICIIIQ